MMLRIKPFNWLEFVAGILVIFELLLTGVVIILGGKWKGNRLGICLDPRARAFAFRASVLLLLITSANMCVIVLRLIFAPDALGNKDELSITAAAFGVLWYTDILCIRPSVRRRRKIADHLAQFPIFRFGDSSYNTPVPPAFQNAEFVVRSADWKLYDNALKRCASEPAEYWRGKVAHCCHSPAARGGSGGAIVVLHDATTQDGAGSELLTPSFTHVAELSKEHVANVIWRTVLRSGVWNIHAWERGFASEMLEVLRSVSAVNGMRTGELYESLSETDCIRGCSQHAQENRLSDTDVIELCTVLWAALAVEVFDFLIKKKPLILLPEFVHIPSSIQSADWTTFALQEACVLFGNERT